MGIAKIGTTQPVFDRAAAGNVPTLREATQQFESLFVSQLMKSMRDTVPESRLMGSGSGQQLFREMLDQELAGRVAQSGGIGIGEMLYQQLSPGSAGRTKSESGAVSIGLAARSETGARPDSATQARRNKNHED